MRALRRRLATVLALAAVAAPAGAALAAPGPPPMRAPTYLLVDGATGGVLAARRPHLRLPMASTTKIMTALLTLRWGHLGEVVRVPAEAAAVGQSSADLVPGERISVRTLLTALLVQSGNDAAVTLADAVAGSQAAFVRRMNAEARRLGLRDTHYENPHGLDTPGHHTSVHDLVALARVAMRRPLFRAIVAHRTATIPGPNGVGVRHLQSDNTLLSIDRDVDGIKTGHTDGAGYSLVAHARRTSLGVSLYLAEIGEPSEAARADDARAMLDWGFAQFARPTLLAPETVVARLAVRDRPGVSVEAVVAHAVRAPIRLGRPLRVRVIAPGEVQAPVRAGQRVGIVQVRSGTTLVASAPLVARAPVAAASVGQRLLAAIRRIA